MDVIQQLPRPALRADIRCYWELTHQLLPGATLNIPFGCTGRMHWIIALENSFQIRYADGTPLPFFGSTVSGQYTVPIIKSVTGTTRVLVIDFTATGFRHLFPVPLGELAGANTEARTVLGTSSDSLVEQLRDTVLATVRFALLDTYMLEHLCRSRVTDGRVEAAVGLLQCSHGGSSVRQVAQQLNCSERTLNRRFHQAVGLPPKAYARVQRFLQTRHKMMTGLPPNWHDLVVEFGYHDQAHLIHEFRHFTGLSPQRYGIQEKPLHDFMRED